MEEKCVTIYEIKDLKAKESAVTLEVVTLVHKLQNRPELLTGCKHYRSECQMTPFEFRSLKGIVQWRTKWVAKGPSILLILKCHFVTPKSNPFAEY